MNQHTTEHPAFTATLTAHQDAERRLLMVTLEVADLQTAEEPGVNAAIVIDRSGSMSGRPIEITRQAVAKLIRSLGPKDRVGVVAYDDRIELVSGMVAPSETLANLVERIEARNNTDLYGGWLMGAKLVGAGGRVILLSDGLANTGRYTDAESLSRHAGFSYTRYRVTTTTIGIGEAYDEALMAGMAREGGGSHYFAHTVDAVMDAFSRERFAFGAIALEQVSLRYGGQTLQLGHLFAGERKAVVLEVSGLNSEPPTLRFTERATGQTTTLPLRLPESFGHDDGVTLEWLLGQVAGVEDEVVNVRDPQSAGRVKERVRAILLKLLAHPRSQEEIVQTVVSRLEARLERLSELERDYDERRAIYERKHSQQVAHNLRHRSAAYSPFAEDQASVQMMHQSAAPSAAPTPLVADPDALPLAPIDQWRTWLAVPLQYDGTRLRVATTNPKDGFLLADMEKALGKKVSFDPTWYGKRQILAALNA